MKILMTADTVGGVWGYALELAAALAPHDVSIVLATMGAPMREHQRTEVAALPNVVVRESRYKLEWMDDPWDDVDRAGEWLLDLERAVRPDLIHLNGLVHGALPWRAPVVAVGHSCVSSWWDAVKGEPLPSRWDEYVQRVRASLRAADLVIAPSCAMRDALDRHYGPLARTRVVHNGRAGWFHRGEKAPFVMTAGRLWDEGKNVAALVRIADALPWPVYVAGSTASPSGTVANLGPLQPLGHLPGPELAEWLARAAIFALPARYEPFGLSVLEAALSGCALVLGDIPSLRELWRDAAVFVRPDDEATLVRAIEVLCNDAPLRRSLAARARHRAHAYTPAAMADGYLSAYDDVRHTMHPRDVVAECAS